MTATSPAAWIDSAAQALDAVLTGDPHVTTRLQVALALATLDDVQPPARPRPAPAEPMDAGHGIALAVAQLRAALAGADVETSLRAGLACSYLLALRPAARADQP